MQQVAHGDPSAGATPEVEGAGRERAVDAGPARILVVDDEQVIREIISDFLLMEGFQVGTAGDAESALVELGRRPYNLVISDLKMPGMGGLELLAALRESHPDVVTLMMTGYGTVETAIEAMKRGAYDYILKPFKVEEVVHTVKRGLEQQRLRAENIELRSALSLYRLAARLGDEIELDAVLRLIVDTVREQTDADRVSVILLPTDEVRWEGAHTGAGEPLTEHDLTEEAIAAREPALATNGRCFRYLRSSDRTASVSSLILLPLVSRGRLLGLLVATRDGARPFVEGQRKLLTILADRAAAAVHNAQLFEEQERTFRETIEAFVAALEDKDRYTRGHSERVAEFAMITAAEMGLPSRDVELVYQGGRLHDIGKLTLKAEELNKPGALSREEFERFKQHPGYGEQLMRRIPCFRPILAAIGGHHEKFDGSGYPRGLRGYDIPLMARIMAVADTYDAMTSHRAYRSALTHAFAVDEIQRCAGTQFDPDVVRAFVVAIEGWRDRRRGEGREYPR
jgi:response regulator RpfG family c-di-GMP phosphodiesterase